VTKDQEVIKNIKAVTADRGYDDGENFLHCQNRHILPAIALRKTRTAPVWDELRDIPLYQEALHLRGRIEAKFGEVKTNHSFHRCRYRGLAKYHIQATLTMLTANLKRIMFLTGTPPGDYCIHPLYVRTT
jgi:IS5 family transposase